MKARCRRLVLLGSVLLCLADPGHAQPTLSPGALSRSHQELDTPLSCLKCHEGDSESFIEQCLACHPEISWLVTNERGLHAQESTVECADCHVEHGGRDATLVRFPEEDLEQFDHLRAGWTLDGRHASVECHDCHKRELRLSEAVRLSPRKDHEKSFIGLERECAACHERVHRSSLGEDCRECHGPTGWRNTTDFDHSRTAYMLTGRHERVACGKCHPESQSSTRLLLQRPHDECSACHRDEHQGRAGPSCSRCHSTDSFHRLGPTSFDHTRTRFPLEGKHLALRCDACHRRDSLRRRAVEKRAALESGSSSERIRCGDCHADAHGGQLADLADHGECGMCHRVEGWKELTLTSQAHATIASPLEGRHASVECVDCHGPRRNGLTLLLAAEGLGTARIAFDLGRLSCDACHFDPHDGRFSPGSSRGRAEDCLACHNLDGFRPSSVDQDAHQSFRFTLNGAHLSVPCGDCHEEMRPRELGPDGSLVLREAESVLFVADQDCVSCHEGPHGSQFAEKEDGGSCGGCHGESSFRPAVRFDHDRDSLFPLLSSHQNVECAECHRKRRKKSSKAVVYRPLSVECRSCHRRSVPAKPLSTGSFNRSD